MSATSTEHDGGAANALTSGLVVMFAIATGAIVANLYYAQPLIGLISPAIGLHGGLTGMVVMSTQLGYAAGLLLVASLSDLVENRRLILICLAGAVLGLLAVAMSANATTFLLASFVVGVCSVATQILVPFAAHLAPEATRGRIVGNVMGGLVAGIMLARPLASLVAAHFGWRAIFYVSAAIMLLLAALLGWVLPRRQPRPGLHYGQILASMVRLMATEPRLRARTAYQALMFAAFSLFWTAIPLALHARFGFGQRDIALFALAGAGGALAAPLAGRMADRGWIVRATGGALVIVILAFALALIAIIMRSLAGLVVAAVTLDAAVQVNQVVGQRVIYGLAPGLRGRLNAIYMTTVFMTGACGSLLSTMTYVLGGFRLTAAAGIAIGLIGLAVFTLTRRIAGLEAGT